VDPGDELEGYVRAGYEFNARERFVEAAVGGPVSDTVKARIAVRGMKMRGWLRNHAVALTAAENPLFGPFGSPGRASRSNGGEELLGRGTLIFTPSDDFQAKLKLSASSYKDNGTATQSTCQPPEGRPASLGMPDPAI